jgi:hypothetical protein
MGLMSWLYASVGLVLVVVPLVVVVGVVADVDGAVTVLGAVSAPLLPPHAVNVSAAAAAIACGGERPTWLADGIFRDSLTSGLVTPVGDPTGGYTAICQVGISV